MIANARAWSFVFLLLATVHLCAQGPTTGRITGTVTIVKGAVIAGATVIVVSKATGNERQVITDSGGTYSVTSLSPGFYRVTVTANGFNTMFLMMFR